jgi:hypothetical protein
VKTEVPKNPSAPYQQLLSAAMRTHQPHLARTLIEMILADVSIHHDDALRIISLASSIAATKRGAAGANLLSQQARRCCILVHQPWFNFHFPNLIAAGLRQNLFLPLFGGVRCTGQKPLNGLTPAGFRTYRYNGHDLWALCQYNLALNERRMPEEVDANQPRTFAAIKLLYSHAAELLDEAQDFVEAYRPESAIIAQGYHLIAAAMRAVAVKAGIRIISVENTFHRERLLWEDVTGISVNLTLAKNYYWRLRDQVDETAARLATDQYFAGIQSIKSSEHLSPSASTATLPIGQRLIVYLGQVSTDASVLFGRRNFRSQVDAIRATVEFAAKSDATVVVKLHPKEGPLHKVPEPFYRGLTKGWLDADPAFQSLVQKLGPRLILDADNQYNTYDLIRNADVCVTINSQSGLEALLLDKEVILCGQAAFGGLDFTHEADDADSLHYHLDRVLHHGKRRNDGVNCRKFFQIYTDYYCVPKTEESFLQLMLGRPPFPVLPPAVAAKPQSRAA